MDRPTPTVAELVRRAVELCDPDDREPALGRFEQQLEDDDAPVTAVDNLEERLALASEGADYAITDPGVSVANAVVLYLAAKRGHGEGERDPRRVMQLAVRAQWRGDPPVDVVDWLSLHAVEP
ncbi:MAG: hypothetical protein JOY58_17500 [Solirubrobacterales bacterium]|nr:hypothetical protein [Solirubrobacterales bacterium]MBV9050073.1 hypothetical protein [Solirubrobacterales bacterium]